uniref:MATH domain-containing protein n=1 Tax=Plectus sambesii TaxID=2011161 RepID=A0A914WMG9_9BILA
MANGKENDASKGKTKAKEGAQSATKPPAPAEKKKKKILKSPKAPASTPIPIIEYKGPRPCPFIEFGCEQKEAVDLPSHISTQPVRHLSILNDGVLAMKIDTRRMYTDWEELMRRLNRAALMEDRMIKAYGSHLLWKIDNWSEHMAAAKENHKTVIFSPGFYTARHGYRMVASIAPYGDGKARGKSMSAFVAIMKGDWDGILDWPYGHPIKLSLLDQSEALGQRQNIDFNIENNAFLRRPDRERNASFGAQHFIDLNMLKTMEYIKDDTVFLRIVIDTEEMLGH